MSIIKTLTPRSDQYVNSPYIFKQTGSKNEENYYLGIIVLI